MKCKIKICPSGVIVDLFQVHGLLHKVIQFGPRYLHPDWKCQHSPVFPQSQVMQFAFQPLASWNLMMVLMSLDLRVA